MAATSSVEAGDNMACDRPWKPPRQAVNHGPTYDGSVTAAFGPKRSRTSSIKALVMPAL